MSVATEFAPSVYIPARARVGALALVAEPALEPAPARRPVRPTPSRPGPARPGTVALLRPPAPERVPLRLTRRGVAVLGLAVALLGLGLVWLARASAPSVSAPRVAPHVVTVQTGDTLWAIATRVAPGVDPRAEVDRLMRVNHLSGPADLVPGLQLRVP